jgi:NADPH:quinone reductase-like Zn-dependent oxidoreductase
METVGEATWSHSLKALEPGGRIVISGATSGPNPPADLSRVFFRQLSIIGSTMGSNKDFSDAMETVWSKKIRPVIDRELPLKDGVEAYRILRDGEQFGKVVLIP